MNELSEQVKQAITPAEKAGELFKLKEAKKKIDSRIKEIQDELLGVMNETGVLQLKTTDYTLFKTVRPTIKCTDYEEAKEYLEANDIPVKVTLDMSYMRQPIMKRLEQEPIPGIEKTVSEYVSVRVTKKKE